MSLSKKYLESLSTYELLKLCSMRGLFLPKGLDRKFAIEELLDLDAFEYSDKERISNSNFLENFVQEKEKEAEEVELFDIENDEKQGSIKKMKLSNHLTGIHILLRDPMWLFVFWDFSQKEFTSLTEKPDFDSFVLRVSLFSEENKNDPCDFYDIDVSKTDRSRYLYLSFDDILTRVDICVRTLDENVTVVCKSNLVYLRRFNIPKSLCILNTEIDKVSNYSGLLILKQNHFKNYRQAFRIMEGK